MKPKSKEQFIDLYMNKKMSSRDLGELYGVSYRTIINWIHEMMEQGDEVMIRKVGRQKFPRPE